MNGFQLGLRGVLLLGASWVYGDAAFQKLADTLLREQYQSRPLDAVALGWHEFDGRFALLDRSAVRNEIIRLKAADQSLDAVDATKLTDDEKRDFQLLDLQIAQSRWHLSTLQSAWRNPMDYASLPDVSVYLKRDFAPLPERVRHITRVLEKVPAHFMAARQQLEPVLARPFVETAIEIADGAADFLAKDVATEATKVTDPAITGAFNAANQKAVSEFRAFAEWLRRERLPNAAAPFAIGMKAYAEMLSQELIGLTPAQVLELGERELKVEQLRFLAAARVIDPSPPAPEVFRSIQQDHPTEQSLIPDTARNLESIRAFIVKRGLVTIPSEVRARVEPTLPPFRSTSFASMDTPGPFETKATEAYYYVTPVEPEWPTAQKNEWLTAFNTYTTDVVSIHEAYPGHYVQFLALNASAVSPVAKVCTSYAFTEGWAHYCEQMLLDEGFGAEVRPGESARDAEVRAAKYRLAQSSEALLRLCRLCASVRMHCHGMTVDQATQFFVMNSYYEPKPARAEARRGTHDPGYCFYTLGKLQLLKLRRDYQLQEGAAYTPKKFHDAVLAHGAPPVRILREILLRDPASWDKIL